MEMKHRLGEAKALGNEPVAHLERKKKMYLLAETQRCD